MSCEILGAEPEDLRLFPARLKPHPRGALPASLPRAAGTKSGRPWEGGKGGRSGCQFRAD